MYYRIQNYSIHYQKCIFCFIRMIYLLFSNTPIQSHGEAYQSLLDDVWRLNNIFTSIIYTFYFITVYSIEMDRSKSRLREFSGTRINYSRLQLDKSRDNHSNLSPSRNIQQSNKSNTGHNCGGLVCVDCYNKKLSYDKHRKESKLKEQELSKSQMTLSQLQEDKHRNSQLGRNELKKMNQYNLKKIYQNQRKRDDERKTITKNQFKDVNKVELQYKQELQYRRQIDEQKRAKLKQDLEKQIAFAKNRRIQQMEQARNGVSKPIIDKPQLEQRLNYENQYKQELLQQISQNKHKKRQEEDLEKYQNLKDNQLQFVRNADQKKKAAEQYQNRTKENMKEEFMRKSFNQQAKKQTEAKQREKEAMTRYEQQRRNEADKHRTEQERRNHIQKYLRDLKKQITQNKVKRQEQYKWIQKQTDNCILAPKTQSNVQPCSSCTKPYPKRQLSPYIAHQQS